LGEAFFRIIGRRERDRRTGEEIREKRKMG